MMNGFIRVSREDGSDEETQPIASGGKVKVTFGEPGLHTGVWSVIANKNGEVYVLEVSTGRYIKASLHKSGDWRYAWVGDNIENHPLIHDQVAMAGTRVIDQWARPDPSRSELLVGYMVLTTSEDVTPHRAEVDDKAADVWMPRPALGHVAFIAITYPRHGQKLRLKGAVPVEAFAMRNGDTVLVACGQRAIQPGEREALELIRSKTAERLRGQGAAVADTQRVLVPGVNDSGVRFVWDLAVHAWAG